jgi:uncharacterized membrane protein YkvA (DUF1232 family)
MSELKVTFTLGERDVAFLRRLIRHAGARVKGQDPAAIVVAAADLARRVRRAGPPQYVLERVEKLEKIVALAQDKDWTLPPKKRAQVITALGYFAAPHDLIPDRVPGLGYLDDAIMIELVWEDFRHELRGYEEYRKYKQGGEQRPWTHVAEVKLAEKKKTIRAKITALETKGESGPRGGFFSRLW